MAAAGFIPDKFYAYDIGRDNPRRENERPGLPVDLESRLQKAWLHSQLNSAKSDPGANGEKHPSLPLPQRISKDLTSTLEQMWNQTQRPSFSRSTSFRSVDVPSESALSSDTSPRDERVEPDEDSSHWLDTIQVLEPVDIQADFMEEEFFRGLDGLQGAFQDLEELLPAHIPEPWEADALDLDMELDLDDLLADDAGSRGPSDASPGSASPSGLLSEALGVQDSTGSAPSTNQGGTAQGGLPMIFLPPGLGVGPSDSWPAIFDDDWRHVSIQESNGPPRSSSEPEIVSEPAPVHQLAVHSQEAQNPIDLLVSIANGIANGDVPSVRAEMARLGEVASVYGNARQRLSAYFLEGLVARISGTKLNEDPSVPIDYRGPGCGASLMAAFEVLVNASPYLTFGHVACNGAILEAFKGASHVHIIDFGLGHGIQWPALLQALSVRPGGPPHVHLTGVDLWAPPRAMRAHCIIDAGHRLSVQDFNIMEGEVVAVNCSLRLHKLFDETVTPSNPRSAVLRTIRALHPKILTIVEQDTNQTSPFFLTRFYEALHYYTTMFETMDSALPSDSKERHLFEQHVLGKAIVNVVACEGQERVERQEPLGQWQARVNRAGFVEYPLSTDVVSIVRSLLRTYPVGYEVVQKDPGSLVLNWKGRSLLAMSAWTC